MRYYIDTVLRYQLESLTWMKGLEETIAAKKFWKYSTLAPWENVTGICSLVIIPITLTILDIFFDLKAHRFYLTPQASGVMTTKGGIFADVMGLGTNWRG